MIDFANMKVGDVAPICKGDWDDTKREILSAAQEFGDLQEPRWQFQANRILIGTPSPKNDEYVIERIR